MSRIEFHVDDALSKIDYSAPFNYYLDPLRLDDGEHTLTITAYDSLGNITSVSYSFTVSAEAPKTAPIILNPTHGTVTNRQIIEVSGTTEIGLKTILYVNGEPTEEFPPALRKDFRIPTVKLTEGANELTAALENRAGVGPQSDVVTVTLDTSIPFLPPLGLRQPHGSWAR